MTCLCRYSGRINILGLLCSLLFLLRGELVKSSHLLLHDAGRDAAHLLLHSSHLQSTLRHVLYFKLPCRRRPRGIVPVEASSYPASGSKGFTDISLAYCNSASRQVVRSRQITIASIAVLHMSTSILLVTRELPEALRLYALECIMACADFRKVMNTVYLEFLCLLGINALK